ncbi:MAG: hypothetical protein IJW39_01995 [Opitutales bacterium]|nr:hypothetical protein [Opitutales bacterium]
MKRIAFLAFLPFVALGTGCASIISDSKYPVTVESFPSGAQFAVKNKSGQLVSQGVTPQQVVLDAGAGFFRPENYTLTFEKQNYGSVMVSERAGIDPWYFGNIVFGGLIGFLIVDPATGAMWDLPDRISANLTPTEYSLPQSDGIGYSSGASRKKTVPSKSKKSKSAVKHSSPEVRKGSPRK